MSASSPNSAYGGERILVMRYRFIGDTLMTVPFLRNLRRAYPNARIDVLVAPRSGEILENCPYLDNLIFYDTTRKHRYESIQGQSPQSFSSYVRELRQRRYDTAFILKRSFSSAALAWMAGIPQRIGFDTELRRCLLTQAVPYRREAHEVDCFLDVLKAVGIPVVDRHLEAWWSAEADARVSDLLAAFPENLQNKRPRVLIHRTASNPEKEWPDDIFFKLIFWLIVEEKATLCCVGAPQDRERYEPLIQRLPEHCRDAFQNFCGRTTLSESLALIHQMDFAVSVDSGTLHMASAVKTPVVALLNPEKRDKWSPVGENNIVITEKDIQKVQDACRQLMIPRMKTGIIPP